MSTDKSIHNLAVEGLKESKQRHNIEREKAVKEAAERQRRLIERALSLGANEQDPLYMQAAIAHYRLRPVVFGEQLVVNIAVDKKGRRYIGDHSRVIGELKFSPLGGLLGIKVVDNKGELMICEGICKADTRWSVFTRGFHLLKKGML